MPFMEHTPSLDSESAVADFHSHWTENNGFLFFINCPPVIFFLIATHTDWESGFTVRIEGAFVVAQLGGTWPGIPASNPWDQAPGSGSDSASHRSASWLEMKGFKSSPKHEYKCSRRTRWEWACQLGYNRAKEKGKEENEAPEKRSKLGKTRVQGSKRKAVTSERPLKSS